MIFGQFVIYLRHFVSALVTPEHNHSTIKGKVLKKYHHPYNRFYKNQKPIII